MSEDEDLEDEDARVPFQAIPIDERFDFRRPLVSAGQELDTVHLNQDTLSKNAGAWVAKDSDPFVGKRIDHLLIESVIGHGGFGSVYKARDLTLERDVAVKFLRFPFDPRFRAQFAREAKTLAGLGRNPHTVQIYTSGEFQGAYYFALELLDTNAQSLIEQSGGQLPVRQALEIVSQCADGLQYAHDNGVLHLDLKPANVLLDLRQHRAKLCDFGLARFFGLSGDAKTVHVAGSPPYMAPEQIAGNTPDARTDVYGLGAILYELLSGHVPVDGQDQKELIARVKAHDVVPVQKRRPDLAAAIVDFIERAMAQHPRDRFQTAAEFKREADRLLASMDSSGKLERMPSRRSWLARISRRSMWLLFAAMFALILLGSGLGVRMLVGNQGVRPWPQALAEERALMDDGKYDAARRALEEYLREHPHDDFAKFALGFTYCQLGLLTEAETVFNSILDRGLHAEGIAAVAYKKDRESSRPTLEDALKRTPTKYPALLLAWLDIQDDNFSSAVERLIRIRASDLYFEIQRRELHRLLGDAYRNSGNFDAAYHQYGQIVRGDPDYDYFLEIARSKEKREQDRDRSDLIDKIRKEWDESGIAKRQDNWTSSPLTITIAPVTGDGGRAARASSLDLLLPLAIRDALKNISGRPIEYVDREHLDEALKQIELEKLSPGSERIKAMSVKAALFSLYATFKRDRDEYVLIVQVVDNGSSSSPLWHVFKFDKTDTRSSLAARIVAELASEIAHDNKHAYAIKGKLTVGGQNIPLLNIGRRVGVRKGMRFMLRERSEFEPSASRECEALRVDDDSTTVQLDGLSPSDIPETGFFAEAKAAEETK